MAKLFVGYDDIGFYLKRGEKVAPMRKPSSLADLKDMVGRFDYFIYYRKLPEYLKDITWLTVEEYQILEGFEQ